MIKRECRAYGCHVLIDDRAGYCNTHKHLLDKNNWGAVQGKFTKNDYGKEWRAISKQYLADNPICMKCGAKSEVVHHIKPYRISKDNSYNNLQALCQSCHVGVENQTKRKAYKPVSLSGIIRK